MASREELLKEYRTLAKRADDRMRSIESMSYNPLYKNVKSFAYAKAAKDIKHWNANTPKVSSQRWLTEPPKSDRALQAKISDIKSFLEMQTSTRRGIINNIKKSTDTLNKHYGTNFTWQEMANFWTSDSSARLDASLGSDTMIRTIAAAKKMLGGKNKGKTLQDLTKNKIVSEVNKTNDKIKRVADNEIVAEKTKALLESGVSYNDLFTTGRTKKVNYKNIF